MPIGKWRYCWDACVFISLLTEKNRTADEIENLRALEALSDQNEITIFAPSIVSAEVLECHLTPEQEQLFQKVLLRPNVYRVSVTRKIADMAREIRGFYCANGNKIFVPDSIYLATAIYYEATALHTYDGCGPRSKKTDLLKLERPIIGKYPLTICTPEPPPKEEPDDEPERPQDDSMFTASPGLFDDISEDDEK